MDESLQNIRDYQNEKSAQNERDIKHGALIDSNLQTQQVIVHSMKMLVDYLDSNISKTEVVNQLQSIGTPDAYRVVEAVNELNDTVSGKEQVDLSEITTLLRSVLQETEKIPKSHNDIKIPEPIDNTKQLKNLEAAIKAVNESVKAQELSVEAPVVNVPETVVNVDKPDLSPIEKEQKKTRTDLVKAIKAIVIPETDVKPLEKELKKLNKLFNEFMEHVPSGGGGGGGRATPYEDSNNVPAFVQVEPDGSIPVTVKSSGSSGTDPLIEYVISDESPNDTGASYYGYAKIDGTYLVMRRDKTSTPYTDRYANIGNNATKTTYAAAWTDRASLSYDYIFNLSAV